MRAFVQYLLQFPLRWKLVGANALLLSAGLILLLLSPQEAPERVAALALLFIAAAVNVVLVYLALVPLATIQSVAEAVTRGDYDRRVPPMILADRDADQSRRVFNGLLDHLAADNARVRRLAGEVTHAREVERLALAHELREGVAQLLFALSLELGVTAREHGEPLAGARARAAHALATEAMEDVGRLAGTLAPAALTELGAPPAVCLCGAERCCRARVWFSFSNSCPAGAAPACSHGSRCRGRPQHETRAHSRRGGGRSHGRACRPQGRAAERERHRRGGRGRERTRCARAGRAVRSRCRRHGPLDGADGRRRSHQVSPHEWRACPSARTHDARAPFVWRHLVAS